MIYLCAQPDSNYFLWQLKVLLHNFEEVGIEGKNIHVLVGYNEKIGLNPNFLRFQLENKFGKLFFYADTRETTLYRPSIRPHILCKHFNIHKRLYNETIFYHDADILLKEEIPRHLEQGENIFVSEAGSYLNINYLKKYGDLMYQMAESIDVDFNVIEEHDRNTGGAQYILKNINAEFWDKLEEDSNRLYAVMSTYNKNKEKGCQIQAWCADMWAIYWRLLQTNRKVYISKELDFCWPKQPLIKWKETQILHNAGVGSDDKKYFCKGKYANQTPFFKDYTIDIDETTCSTIYVNAIQKYEHKFKYTIRDEKSSLVSVIVILDKPLTTIISIESIINQNFTDLEIIIMDSGSNKDILKGVLKYPNIFYKRYRCNACYQLLFNDAISCSQGQFIAFTDPGERMEMERISEQVGYLTINKKIGAVGAWIGSQNLPSQYETVQEYCIEPIFVELSQYFFNSVNFSTILARKTVLQGLNFDGKNSFSAKFAYVNKINAKTKIGNIPRALNYTIERNSNNTILSKKEDHLSMIKIMGNRLDTLNIPYSAEELVTHCTIGFHFRSSYFKDPDKLIMLHNWLTKFFKSEPINTKYKKSHILSFKKFLVSFCSI